MRPIRALPLTAVALATALALTACGRHAPLAPDAVGARAAGGASALALADGAQHVEGATGPGSTYSIDVPAGWNGDLVLYAHGIVLPVQQPVGLPGGNFPLVRDMATARGFAVAASSYDANGYCVKDGAQRTHQLIGLFAERFGAPRRVYLVGSSLGGLIVEDLAETYPAQFAGALSLAGPLGGTMEELDYVANVRVLFDCMYPGVMPGTLYQVPPMAPAEIGALQQAIVSAIQARPQGVGVIAALEPRVPYTNGTQLVTSIVMALMFQALGASDLAGRAHGHSFFDNHDKVYAGPLPQPVLDAVNAQVARFTADPDAVTSMRRDYSPTGDLRVPMVTLHYPYDAKVPAVHERIYRDLVAARGRLGNLRQYPIPTGGGFGHDQWDPLVVEKFDELVAWTSGAPVEWTP